MTSAMNRALILLLVLSISGAVFLTPSAEPSECFKIAYTVFPRKGRAHIFIMNSDGSGVRQLTHGHKISMHLSWSPDGNEIVFASKRDGHQYDIYVMDASGENVIRLTDTSWDERHPVWSPPLSLAVTPPGKMAISWGRVKSERW